MNDGFSTGEPVQQAPERRTSWISSGLERLIRKLGTEPDLNRPADFDVVIVGSGYGGAIAADRLAGLCRPDGQRLRVCVLERGREYLPGAFPGRMAELGGHVRFTTPAATGAKGRLEGLFDVRVGKDVSTLVANGVGGGSLINAGVMEFASRAIFSDPAWPEGLPSYDTLQQRAHKIRQELGAGTEAAPNCIEPRAFGVELQRLASMRRLGAQPVAISVALSDSHVTSGDVRLRKCIGCGDCATGCNHSAKDSLDVSLLRRATRQPGVSIHAGATVSCIRRAGNAWELDVWHTDAALRRRMAGAFRLRAKKVIVAAGTLGSTELLMRSQSDGLRFSEQLGQRFSGNGDVLAAIYDAAHPIRGVADESEPPRSRRVGPTITAMVDARNADGSGFVVQDLGVPGPLRRLFEEASTTSWVLHRIGQADATVHEAQAAHADPCAVDPDKIDRSVAVAIIGRDSASGVLSAVPDEAAFPADAGVRIDWQSARDDACISLQHEWLERRVAATGFGGQILPNPMWQALPETLRGMLGARRGPLLSVHPLGGCPMGHDRLQGVVNVCGEVFNGSDPHHKAVHPGLAVLDGSIVPVSLGINPALTIATLADAAVERLIVRWRLRRARPHAPAGTPAPGARPVFKPMADSGPPRPTTVQVVERLGGWVRFERAPKPLWVELSLVYADAALFAQSRSGRREAPTMLGHVLRVAADTDLSRVRVFEKRPSKFVEAGSDQKSLFEARVQGSSYLRFFHQEDSTSARRLRRAWWAWLRNRGMRDSWQEAAAALRRLGGGGGLPAWERLMQSFRLASRAGAARLFDYSLSLKEPTRATGPFEGLQGQGSLRVAGRKRLTYERRCSPWEQLMRLELTDFPRMQPGPPQRLKVDPFYFALKGIPLLRLVEQQDQPSALVDTLAFALYCARVLIDVHLWSFRKPDQPAGRARQRLPNRLPGRLPGLPAPQFHTFTPNGASRSTIRLTCYPSRSLQARRPVLMIHGYSASGTTFAHPSVKPNLAGHLWRRGFEPWIVDLRTSCGMPTATQPWTFEQVALLDIPQAVHRVCSETGAARIGVVSHCMGSAMLAMALLADDPRAQHTVERIDRWVMSQVGPAVYFSPANLLRAYIVRYVHHLLPGLRYDLRPGGAVPGFDADLYDRLVASLPYLDDARGSEFDIENPSWLMPWRRTPWTGTRHRLDALIGRTFDARRMRPETLDHIDDFFGPISLATLSQPTHFARKGFVTGSDGLEQWGYDNLGRLAGIRLLSLHSLDNGLADWETALLLQHPQLEMKNSWRAIFLRNRGHQDCLIGRNNAKLFRLIGDFLQIS